MKILGEGPVLCEVDASKKATHHFVSQWLIDKNTPTTDAVEKIVEHVELLSPADVDLDSLAGGIGGAVAEYFSRSFTARRPTKAQAVKALEKIAKRARRLRDALPARGTQDHADLLSTIWSATRAEDEAEARYRQEHAHEVLDAVVKLAGWLEDALANPPLTRFSDDGESPEYWLFGRRLAEVYEAFFKRDSAYSRPFEGGQPTGPYVRFAMAIAEGWGVQKRDGSSYSPEIVADALRFYRKRAIGKNG